MSITTEILIAAAIVGSMLLQFGEHQATARRLIAPLVIVIAVAVYYWKGLPTTGNDLLFAGAGALIGIVLGVAAALLMGVRRDNVRGVLLTAGMAYVVLWIVTFALRLGFAVVATNSPETLHQLFIWTFEHGITETGWTGFFMLQALVMVGARTAIIGARVLIASRNRLAYT